jgi:hypothetical protein
MDFRCEFLKSQELRRHYLRKGLLRVYGCRDFMYSYSLSIDDVQYLVDQPSIDQRLHQSINQRLTNGPDRLIDTDQ